MIFNSVLDHNAKHLSSMASDGTPRKKAFTSLTSDEYMSLVIVQIVAGQTNEKVAYFQSVHYRLF